MCVSPLQQTLAISTDKGQMFYINFDWRVVRKHLYGFNVCTVLNLATLYQTNGHLRLHCFVFQNKQETFKHLFHTLHSGRITSLSVCSDKPLFATCSTDNTVRIWNHKTKYVHVFVHLVPVPKPSHHCHV